MHNTCDSFLYNGLCLFDVYWKKLDNKKVLIARQGDVPNYNLLQNIGYDKLILDQKEFNTAKQLKHINELDSLLEFFKNSKFEKDNFDKKVRWLFTSMGYLWNEEPVNMILLSNYFLDKLFSFDEKEKLQMQMNNQALFKRQSILAASLVLGAICLGHHSYTFLKNIYNAAFMVNAHGLLEVLTIDEYKNILNYDETIACPDLKKEILQAYVEESLSKTQDHYSHYFSNVFAYKIIKLNFMSINGNDYSHEINQNCLSDLEQIFCCFNLFLYKSEIDDLVEVSGIFKTLGEHKTCVALTKLKLLFTGFEKPIDPGVAA